MECSALDRALAFAQGSIRALLSGEIPVDTTTAGDQLGAAIAPDPGSGFTVAWSYL
jgi:hypothetical protein